MRKPRVDRVRSADPTSKVAYTKMVGRTLGMASFLTM